MKIKLTKEGQRACTGRETGKVLAHEGDVLEGIRITEGRFIGDVRLTGPMFGILIFGEYVVVEE